MGNQETDHDKNLSAYNSQIEQRLLDEADFETRSDEERQIWTAVQLCGSANTTWLNGLSLIGRANYHSPSHVVPLEAFARHYEIIFVDKGQQTHWLDGQSYLLKSGDCFLIRPRQQHSTAQQAEERGRFYWWIFNPTGGLLGLDAVRSWQLMEALRQCFSLADGRETALCRLSSRNAVQMRNTLVALFHDWAEREAEQQLPQSKRKSATARSLPKVQTKHGIADGEQTLLAWEHSLQDLFFLISREQGLNKGGKEGQKTRQLRQQGRKSTPPSAKDKAASDAAESCQYLRQICDYIAEHISSNLTFKELSDLTPYSEAHLLRLFRSEYGLPLRDYINREKIYKAQQLLQQGMAVTAVAAELGFSSSQYFSVVFRRYGGLSPSAWRKQQAE